MTKLSDAQLVVLGAACQRDDRCVYPVTTKAKGGAAAKILGSLVKKKLIEEAPARRPAHRARFQRLVVGLFRPLADSLQRYVHPHLDVAVVEQLQRQQPGHSSVAIRKRVYAQEVEDGQWREYERVGHVSVD